MEGEGKEAGKDVGEYIEYEGFFLLEERNGASVEMPWGNYLGISGVVELFWERGCDGMILQQFLDVSASLFVRQSPSELVSNCKFPK